MMAIINYTANQSESDCDRLEAVCLPSGNLCNLLVIECSPRTAGHHSDLQLVPENNANEEFSILVLLQYD